MIATTVSRVGCGGDGDEGIIWLFARTRGRSTDAWVGTSPCTVAWARTSPCTVAIAVHSHF